MRTVWLVAGIAIIVVLFTYTWLNRDSDRVILTFFTAVLIGAIGFATKESVSNKNESYIRSFHVVSLYSAPSYMPVKIRFKYLGKLSQCIQNINKNDFPENDGNMDILFAEEKYFDAFQYLILKEVFSTYRMSWLIDIEPAVMGVYTNSLAPGMVGKEIEFSEVLNKIPDNYIVKNNLFDKESKIKAMFPPGVDIKVEFENKNNFKVMFESKYISIIINLVKRGSSNQTGEYGKLLSLPSTDNKYGMSTYKVTLEVKQQPLLNGNPKMKNYRKWADSLVDLLEREFSYELALKKHKEDYKLYGSGEIGL